MTSQFANLENSLFQEGITPKSELFKFIPTQGFYTSFTDFVHSFQLYFKSQKKLFDGVIVFTDGVSKRVKGSEKSVDNLLKSAMTDADIPHEWVNVPTLLQIDSGHFHAAVEHLPVIIDFLRERQNRVCVVVGSGTLTDVIKHACFVGNFSIPFVVIPTALTVTAFTSAFAVLEEFGAKRTRPSRPVDACFWIAPLLQAAPANMSRAGYGDLLARFVAYADWYLSFELGIATRYDELAFRLMECFAEPLKKAAPGFALPILPLNNVEETAAALSMAGIAMSVSGETTPLSGYEHVISHALDFLRLTSSRPLVLHGEQVALASLSSALSLDFILKIENFDITKMRVFPVARARGFLQKLIGSAPYWGREMASWNQEILLANHESIKSIKANALDIFYSEYAKKHEKWLIAFEKFSDFEKKWPEIKSRMQSLTLRSHELENLLALSGLPSAPEGLNPSTSAEEYRWALRFSPFVRARMSLGDFIYWTGEDPALVAIA